MKLKLLIVGLLAGTIGNAQPVYDWAKSVGSLTTEYVHDITSDAAGNVYVTGEFSGTVDFDPGPGAQTLTATGADIFIGKFDASGNLIWVKSINQEGGYSIAVDAAGNVYTTGLFFGTADFDPGPGTYTLTGAGSRDVFVSKLDASGNFIWAKAMGGAGYEQGNSITVDAAGNVYTTGITDGGDFDPGPGIQLLTGRTFISKLDAAGNYVWAVALASADGYSIAVDAAGNVYTTGYFANASTDFDPGPGTVNLTHAGNADIFVSKLDASGNFVWAKGIGGADAEVGSSLALDATGNIYITGSFQNSVDFDPGAGTNILTSVSGTSDMYVSKLDASGNLVWAKSMGSSSEEDGISLAVDASGNVYTSGYFNGTVDFDPGAGTQNLTAASGTSDVFVSKLDASGNYVWAFQLGNGSDSEGYWYITVNGNDNVYITGDYSNTVDFDPGAGTQDLAAAGSTDFFIAHLIPNPLPLTLLQFQAENNGNVVQMHWQTTQEENTASFSIERSSDGKNYIAIGFVAAANGALKNNYSFNDTKPLDGTGLYRLKMIDIDGKFTYSRIVSVRRDNNDVLLITPNPAREILYVQAKGSEPVTVQITDVNGRILQQQKITLNGNTSFSVNIQQLPTGNYYLLVKGKQLQQVKEFIKQ
jgi:type IX secretion system substrate protein/beta-propeller repeat-containing protein